MHTFGGFKCATLYNTSSVGNGSSTCGYKKDSGKSAVFVQKNVSF